MSRPATPLAATPRANRALAIAGGVLASVLLTVVFWRPLWTGGGLVGSDIYAYYLPQKAYFVDQLRAGSLPLWNNQIGNGYPQVAESQTGVFYPLHLALYPLLGLNTAYSASVILHYVLAFLFTWMYARQVGLKSAGALLAALVYTYGWFPPRICLEWAIVGGAWLPLGLWCVEKYLESRYWRYALFLTVVLGVQMLAGHFLLAFITQLLLVGYVPVRVWWATGASPAGTEQQRVPLTAPFSGKEAGNKVRAAAALFLALVGAFPFAAVQLMPTWELKHQSQRQGVSKEHDPGFGYIPPRYLSQIALPWLWYGDAQSFGNVTTRGASRTNAIEAHLYFGLIPLLLAVWRLAHWRHGGNRLLLIWSIAGLAALIYTTGWLVPLTKHLPGFSFFEGPGRFGVVTTLAAGLWAGSGCDDLFGSLGGLARKLTAIVLAGRAAQALAPSATVMLRCLTAVIVFGGTTCDLFVVSRSVTVAELVMVPPLDFLPSSPLRRLFAERPQPARIFSEGKNLPSLIGTATVPTYLGLGPAQYYDPAFTLPQPWPFATSPTDEQLEWLHRHGVTHFLAFAPADARAWSARLVWEGADPFINAALARPANAGLFLYTLEGSRGRVALESAQPGSSARIVEYRANSVAVDAESPAGGRLILTDLAYPGWEVAVDGKTEPALVVENMFRAVYISKGKHRVVWNYRPSALYWGAGVSIVTLVILLAVGHVRYWHPGIFRRERRSAS